MSNPSQEWSPATLSRLQARRAFLETCAADTTAIHLPLSNPLASRGHPNPARLGQADAFSLQGSWGQSSVLFPDLASYHQADESGVSPYGGAEYGVPLTPEADAVCQKMATLHGGAGAVVCPSGLSAISTALDAFAPKLVLIPDNVYLPFIRYQKRRNIQVLRYAPRAGAAEITPLLQQALLQYSADQLMMYLEAPGSGTFEIPDIAAIVKIAAAHGVRSVMDNTWASHVRCRPISLGVDVVIQATTKYEGGYGDTPSGVVIARTPLDFKQLSDELRASGNGAVAPATCSRLLQRIESAKQRLDRHDQTALTLARWFLQQAYVEDVLSPALESSPDHARFLQYFGKGNGLFSVVFKAGIGQETVTAFIDALNLFWVAESWGGHLSLVLPVSAPREIGGKPQSVIIRFHAGLEDADDLLRDVAQAAGKAFPQG
jgi:cystathionine beta-lyase